MAKSSDASMLSTDSSEDSDSSNEGQSSDEVNVVVENMKTTSLRGDKGMWSLKKSNLSGTFGEFP